ncbi:Cyclin-like F-box [Fusarium albosuccineum]|uniref:Cyclin-like F-box n=1 Tax=Fusarium albosuccineum TaxID=1237068 RepID=A0A8H4LBD8_9HYPO|nr:Cyclin-like F-box [Fusarium albosuccineum]
MADPAPPGYRSNVEYRFRQEQADAIVRTTAYYRDDFRRAVISFPHSEHEGIRSSIATPFRQPSVEAVPSGFERLPLELLHIIIPLLDMGSVFALRQASVRCRVTVDSLKKYQLSVSHGLDPFCALLRTRLASTVSLSDFYSALSTKACALCGGFAGFIFLLTWTRCCFRCLHLSLETQVRSLNYLRRILRLTKAQIAQLTTFKTLPGVYTPREVSCKSRVIATSVDQAEIISGWQLGRRLWPGPDQLVVVEGDSKYNCMSTCALPYRDGRTGKVEQGGSCAGCQLALEKGIIGAWGETNKVYSQDDFLEHFRWCEQAQRLWISSEQRNRTPDELPVAARGGCR